ncbi:MAG: phage tail protein [Desulfobacteraceae bacterium]
MAKFGSRVKYGTGVKYGTEADHGYSSLLPLWFSEFGFNYDDSYDPGAIASVVIGCLYIYMRNGNESAYNLARFLLDDLKGRASGDFGGHLYRSDYHYAWLNALVAHAFGLAICGRSGSAYQFPANNDDADHFDAMLSRFFALSGDYKPNVLNSDLIPFTYVEDKDAWDYAPHYMFTRQMGSMEGVVLMLQAALDYAVREGDWDWFDRLLKFILLDNLVVLDQAQLREVVTTYDLTGLKNLVRVQYADYDQDNCKYAEAKDPALIDELDEISTNIDLRYGRPVVTEDANLAATLAQRLLARLSAPRETAEVETWLEGARIELGDTVAISSDFHGLEQTEFECFGKAVQLGQRRTRLTLARQISYTNAWAVDSGGTAYDSCAIDSNNSEDKNWPYRAYAY